MCKMVKKYMKCEKSDSPGAKKTNVLIWTPFPSNMYWYCKKIPYLTTKIQKISNYRFFMSSTLHKMKTS